MNTMMDTLLSHVDKAASRLGPVDGAVAKVAARVLPRATAKACGGVYCWSQCTAYQPADCIYGYSYREYIYVAPSIDDCNAGRNICIDNACC
jgi:hypothetical protein